MDETLFFELIPHDFQHTHTAGLFLLIKASLKLFDMVKLCISFNVCHVIKS